MVLNEKFTRAANASPFSDQARTAKQIPLHGHQIKPAHLLRRVNTAQMQPIGENLKLRTILVSQCSTGFSAA
jgi:hypothetical protein